MAAYVELLHGTEPSWRAKAAAAGCPTLIAAASTSTEVAEQERARCRR